MGVLELMSFMFVDRVTVKSVTGSFLYVLQEIC